MLFKRESCVGEVILVCNDRTNEDFKGCHLYNMELCDYEKPKMCNFGVKMASYEMVALLDSDRILPKNYFSKQAMFIKRGEFVSCKKILELIRNSTDEEIESGNFDYNEEIKSDGWCPWKKNLFSGNTLFRKIDYENSGGMDESFVGCGFADNDMTKNIISRGFVAKWEEGPEIHLWHPKESMENKEMVGFEKRKKAAKKNLCRFLRKWHMKEYWLECPCLN
jgi:hypothetical protein